MKKRRSSLPGRIITTLVGCPSANLLIGLNVGCYLYYSRLPQAKQFIFEYLLYPGNLFSGRWWVVVTSGFLHSSWEHLLLNMLGIFVFARVVERHLGFGKTLLIYFGSLCLSMLMAILIYTFVFHRSVGIMGASGAVMGLIGAAVLLDPFRVTYEMIVPLPTMVKGWLFLAADVRGLLNAESDGVSHLAHLFGFFSIGLLVYLLSRKERQRMKWGLLVNIVSFVLFVGLRIWWAAGRPFPAISAFT